MIYGYIRVSTDKQDYENQKLGIEEKAKSLGFAVDKYIEKERLKHIFANQVYGLAPTEILYRIACAYILGFDEEASIKKHHLKQFDTLPSVQKGTLETDLDSVLGQN